MNSIFNELNPNKNDLFSELNNADLLHIIVLINKYYLSLRDKLGLNKEDTFGLELEVEYANKACINSDIRSIFPAYDWVVRSDNSLVSGTEINSPILNDCKKSWADLDIICFILKKYSKISLHCGGHIHIGAQALGNNNNSWLNFIKLWSAYENIIYRFGYGEYLTPRPSINEYAYPVSTNLFKDYNSFINRNVSFDEILDEIDFDRYQGVNFSNVDMKEPGKFSVDNTIEFRCPNGTLNPIIWQNNVNFFMKLLYYAKNKNFNDEIVSNRLELTRKYADSLEFYELIFLDQALELCDMIFYKNIDKVYFLRQYLKNFQVDNYDKFVKAKKLTLK